MFRKSVLKEWEFHAARVAPVMITCKSDNLDVISWAAKMLRNYCIEAVCVSVRDDYCIEAVCVSVGDDF